MCYLSNTRLCVHSCRLSSKAPRKPQHPLIKAYREMVIVVTFHSILIHSFKSLNTHLLFIVCVCVCVRVCALAGINSALLERLQLPVPQQERSSYSQGLVERLIRVTSQASQPGNTHSRTHAHAHKQKPSDMLTHTHTHTKTHTHRNQHGNKPQTHKETRTVPTHPLKYTVDGYRASQLGNRRG